VALPTLIAFIGARVRHVRGRDLNSLASFIHPCQPTLATKPPSGPGWVHEVKHDGYRFQIHVRDGRVRLCTMNGADWSKRYPMIVKDAAWIGRSAIIPPKSSGWARVA